MKKETIIRIPLYDTQNEITDWKGYIYGYNCCDDTIFKAIKRYADELDIKQDQLAKLLGVSVTLAHYYLTGERNITFDMLIIICISLRLHPLRIDHLFELSQYELHKSDPRYYILKEYLYGCAFIEHYTVKSCNKKLKANVLKSLRRDKRAK